MGSSEGRVAELGAVVLSPLASIVPIPAVVALDPSPEDPLEPVAPVPLLIEVSELEPEVARDDPSDVVAELVALVELSLVVVTVPETVRSLEPELIGVATVELSTVVSAGAMATGAGALGSVVVIGDGSPAVELLTSVGEPLDESASTRPFGALAETSNGVLASVASDGSAVGVEAADPESAALGSGAGALV